MHQSGILGGTTSVETFCVVMLGNWGAIGATLPPHI
jgi:hypothetical protein